MTCCNKNISDPAEREAHRRFLNAYYGRARHFYDLTRRYYLLGRQRLLERLVHDRSWSRLIEVGPGTGRNLRWLHAARPDAVLGGVEPCDEMLSYAAARCPFATLRQGFAEDADLTTLLGARPDRVLFSYSLSMVQDPRAALERAVASLAPGGAVEIVDFADLGGLPWPLRPWFLRFLRAYHVQPLHTDLFSTFAKPRIEFAALHYYTLVTIPG